MNTHLQKAGESRGRAVRTGAAVALGALAGLALSAVAAHAQAPQVRTPRPTLGTERTVLEQHVQGLLTEAMKRRAVRPVAAAVVERDARRLAAALSDRELRQAFDREDVSTLLDEAIAKTAVPASTAAAAPTLGDSNSDLLFVPLPPCRIIDTRVAGGALTAGTTRSFRVNGTDEFQAQGGQDGGCGVPAGAVVPQATAAVLNFVAVGPAGPGDLRAWPYGQPKPTASIINYAAAGGLNIANGVIVPIAGSSMFPDDINVSADVSGTHLVVDVTGYFTRFPVEQFTIAQPFATQADGGVVSLNNTSLQSCVAVDSCNVTVNATGHVMVQAWVQVNVDHTQGIHDRVVFGLKNNDPTACTNFNETVNAVDFEVLDVVPTDPGIEWTLDDSRTFFQSAADGTVTYYSNAAMGVGASAGDQILASRMICTFYPD